jgi:hypothetical protein
MRIVLDTVAPGVAETSAPAYDEKASSPVKTHARIERRKEVAIVEEWDLTAAGSHETFGGEISLIKKVETWL